MLSPARSVIVTGGNSGLGLECARALARRGWHVVIAARDAAKSERAVRAIRGEGAACHAEALTLDLASLAAIRAFAQNLIAGDRPPLHALVCNAGIQLPTLGARTAEGFERTFGVNHLGHFLLVRLLLPRLVPPVRIVVVVSAGHDPARRTGLPAPQLRDARRMALPETDSGVGPDAVRAARCAYATSKLCNVLFVRELARRLAERRERIAVDAFDPGFMPGTDLGRDMGPVLRFFFGRVLSPLSGLVPGVVHPRDSGARLAELVCETPATGAGGRYVTRRGDETCSAEAQDSDKAAALWRQSNALVGLDDEEGSRAAHPLAG